ncbi:MAG: hypothetical protein J7L42_05835, partial [Elusimicrobia bacterium]|nr:hypothetical protein [Elusimicrobiota bacterium]
MLNKFFLSFIFLVATGYAEVSFTLIDFEKENINNFGGICNVWEKDPEDNSEFCQAKIIKRGKNSFLRLHYKETPASYNGYYLKLNGADLRPYENFEFRIKSRKNDIPKILKIELKNAFN